MTKGLKFQTSEFTGSGQWQSILKTMSHGDCGTQPTAKFHVDQYAAILAKKIFLARIECSMQTQRSESETVTLWWASRLE